MLLLDADELAAIYTFKLMRLRQIGYDEIVAEQLAEENVDVHLIVGLIGAGATHDEAARIAR